MIAGILDSIKHFDLSLTAGISAVLAAIVLFVLANAVVVAIVVRVPATYFCDPPTRLHRGDRHWALRWAMMAVKNLLGMLIVIVGVILTLPGIPGPGLVLILIGAILVDFPGKRRLVQSLMRRKRVLRSINGLRRRFGKPPLVVPKSETT